MAAGAWGRLSTDRPAGVACGRARSQSRCVHLPTLLRDARRREGLSIRAAALRCAVPPSTWADWESGRAAPSAVRLDVVLSALALDLQLASRVPEPPGEQVVARHLRRSLTERARSALGDQFDSATRACRAAPRLLTGAAAVGVWVPHVVSRGPLPLPLPASQALVGLVPICLDAGDAWLPPAWVWVACPGALVLDRLDEQWPWLVTSARLLATEAPRDAAGRRLPAHRDPDEDREVRDLSMALTWAGRGTIPITSADSRAWRLDGPATLDQALLRHGLPARNTSRRGGPRP